MAPRNKKVTLKKPVIRRSSHAAEKKPLLSIGTLITVVVFAAVILLGVYLARQGDAVTAENTPAFEEPVFLFSQADLTLTSIEVAPAGGEAVKLTRNEENIWTFELPQKAEADQGAVEAAASQVRALEVLDTLPAGSKPADFGIEASSYVISLKFSDGKTRVMEVGDASPINTGYYVRVDKGSIQLVDLNGIDALTQLAIFPPYPPTPSPEATPTP